MARSSSLAKFTCTVASPLWAPICSSAEIKATRIRSASSSGFTRSLRPGTGVKGTALVNLGYQRPPARCQASAKLWSKIYSPCECDLSHSGTRPTAFCSPSIHNKCRPPQPVKLVAQPLSSNACRKSQDRKGSNGTPAGLAKPSQVSRATSAIEFTILIVNSGSLVGGSVSCVMMTFS